MKRLWNVMMKQDDSAGEGRADESRVGVVPTRAEQSISQVRSLLNNIRTQTMTSPLNRAATLSIRQRFGVLHRARLDRSTTRSHA